MAEAPGPGKPSEAENPPGAAAAPTEAAPSAPPPVGNPGDYLEIKVEPNRAVMTIKGSIAAAGLALAREDVARKLQSLKVVKGVDWSAVDRMIQGKQYDRGQIIAQGVPPKPGRDASIRVLVKAGSDLSPVVRHDGRADYRNVDNIHQVKKGEVLAVKTPLAPGEPGEDIFGKTLPAPAAKDAQFKQGANTAVSEDGLSLVAAVGGFVYENAGALSVGITYVLKGDVDFHTGNLHYHGDIQVLGNVKEGFTVEADGDVTIEGTVEGAEVVSHEGSVTLRSAAFGHGKGRIAAKRGIRVSSAQDLRIECEEGTVEVGKGLRNCQVVADALKAGKPGCAVMGGEVRAYSEVEIADLGGEGCHTLIRILDKAAEAAKARLREIEKARAELPPRIEPLEKKLKYMKAMVAKFGAAMSERAKADLKSVADGYAALRKAEKDLDEEKERLAALLAAPPEHAGRFAVTEKLTWGAMLDIHGHAKELEAGDEKKEWTWAPGGLQSRPLTPSPPPSAPGPTAPDPQAAPPA